MKRTNQLHTLRAGSGPALLLLHGIGASGTAWTRQIDQPSDEFTCIARRHAGRVASLVLADATLGRADRAPAERESWLQHRRQLSVDLATRSLERAAQIAGPDAPLQVLQEIATHMRRACATHRTARTVRPGRAAISALSTTRRKGGPGHTTMM